jgi:DNA-directed RNA polymerase II subunit RPB1
VVERHLKDGDYVVFNRQPTLHKMSMMGHRVVVMPHNTFRMNLSATSSYNADFDGDEMNLHVAQGYESISEIKELMMVSKNMISPQANRPVMGIIQDSLVACRLLTMRDVLLTKEDVTQLMLSINEFQIPIPCIIKPITKWSGKQLLSMLFFPELNMRKYSAWHDDSKETPWFSESDTEIYIDKAGELLTGTLCKKTLGAASYGIVHKAWLIDNEKACHLVSRIQFLVNKWLLTNGFSVGISDCVTKNTKEVTDLIDDNMRRINTILQNAVMTGSNPSKKEGTISTILNNARDVSGRYVQKDLTTKNNLFTMVSGGSKGSVINIAQIMACVGQQNVNGQRVAFGYDNRTLPHFKQNDHGPESKGFVKHSYMQGLTPSEFFFHAMGGREGVIDTAIKTSESGYIQRRLVKSMEDITVGFDGVVRNSIGDIVQFRYGEDGFDGSLLFSQKIDKNNPWGLTSILFPIELNEMYWSCSKSLPHDHTRDDHVSPIIDWLIQKHMKSEDEVFQKRKQMNSDLESYLVNPGEMVGVIAAQSLGQPITQMTLNTFHFSGIASKSVTLGVPRLKELINMSKTIKSPSTYITMKAEYVHSKMFRFNGTTLNHYVKGTSVHFKLDLFDFEIDYLKHMKNVDLENTLRDGCWVIVYSIDVYEVGKQGSSMSDLTVCVQQQYDNVWCVCNDETSENPVLVVRIMTPVDVDDIDYAKRLSIKMKMDLNIKGYPNIKETYVNEYNPLVVETAGTDYENLLCDYMIDPYHTYTNNIIETYQVLGIEAAREMLLREIRNVIEYDGSYVDYRHVSLLVDTMTYKGMLMSITRHGINRTETGVLMRCSFEETVNIITDAAVFGEHDQLKGITENIVMGKHSKIGTGYVDILIDTKRMSSYEQCSILEFENNHNDVYVPSTPEREVNEMLYVDSFYT